MVDYPLLAEIAALAFEPGFNTESIQDRVSVPPRILREISVSGFSRSVIKSRSSKSSSRVNASIRHILFAHVGVPSTNRDLCAKVLNCSYTRSDNFSGVLKTSGFSWLCCFLEVTVRFIRLYYGLKTPIL